MKYSVPVNAPDEVEALAAAGASELYCGYLDAWWVERYGDHDSASRRQGRANLSTPEELEATVRAAERYGLPIHLALNARYTEPQLDHLVELCGQFDDWGGTGVILSDLGLLWRLNDEWYSRDSDLAITLSLLAVAQNTATLRAYQELDVTRVVFPRFVGWQEAGALLMGAPGMEASVMAFFDKCPLVDGYCRHRHGVSYPDRMPSREVGTDASDGASPLYTFDTTYSTHACLGASCTYLEPYPCAACYLRAFERAGVGTAKIGGRGRPLGERLRALRFLRAAERLDSDEQRMALYGETFGRPCACYYGESTQSRYAIEPVAPRASTDGRVRVGSEAPRDRGGTLDDDRQADGRVRVGSDRRESDGRVRVGSETNIDDFLQALRKLCRGEMPATGSTNGNAELTLLVPPLSNGTIHAFLVLVPALMAHVPLGTHVAVNDLGTLAELVRVLTPHVRGFRTNLATGETEVFCHLKLTLGTLLARLDDPREVAHFLSAEENPSRPVWDLDGRPRMLTYAPPPAELVKHWQTPSLTEPSAQEALNWVLSWDSRIPYEFA